MSEVWCGGTPKKHGWPMQAIGGTRARLLLRRKIGCMAEPRSWTVYARLVPMADVSLRANPASCRFFRKRIHLPHTYAKVVCRVTV
jgi:hypothetical protein